MTEIIEKLSLYFGFSFVQYAFLTGLLITICTSLFGTTLVLKRFSFIGDTLSHVAFGAMAVANVAGLTNNMFVILPITAISALLLLKPGQDAKIKGDSFLAMLSVASLAFGYALMNIFPVSSNVSGDVCTTLFGSTSILTLSKADVWICFILSVIVVCAYIFLYNRIFAVSFDDDFSSSCGLKTKFYNCFLAITTAVVISLAMKLVGSLLISALIIFPSLSSMRIFDIFKSVTISSVFISIFCTIVGMLVSILCGTPVGATIVIADIIIFLGCCIIGHFIKR